jgi:thiamine transport system substrate-binding protein
MRRVLLVFTIAFTIALAPTSGALSLPTASAAAAAPSTTIILVTHDSFAVSKKVLAAFTKRTGITVKVLPSGDAGAALNQVILTKSNPIGDVFFGVDNTYLSRALDAGVFEKYAPGALSTVPATYQLDPSHRLTPIDHGDVCINYDKQWFAEKKLAATATTAGATTGPSCGPTT